MSRVATTPVGRFRIYRKAVGWQPSFPGAAAIPFFQRNPVGTPVIIVR